MTSSLTSLRIDLTLVRGIILWAAVTKKSDSIEGSSNNRLAQLDREHPTAVFSKWYRNNQSKGAAAVAKTKEDIHFW